jgi:hypothetical protein
MRIQYLISTKQQLSQCKARSWTGGHQGGVKQTMQVTSARGVYPFEPVDAAQEQCCDCVHGHGRQSRQAAACWEWDLDLHAGSDACHWMQMQPDTRVPWSPRMGMCPSCMLSVIGNFLLYKTCWVFASQWFSRKAYIPVWWSEMKVGGGRGIRHGRTAASTPYREGNEMKGCMLEPIYRCFCLFVFFLLISNLKQCKCKSCCNKFLGIKKAASSCVCFFSVNLSMYCIFMIIIMHVIFWKKIIINRHAHEGSCIGS